MKRASALPESQSWIGANTTAREGEVRAGCIDLKNDEKLERGTDGEGGKEI